MGKERELPIRIVVRKKVHGGGHHGGAWKVAFADFMTAMFAMFLVLWLVNQSSDVKSAVAGYFQDPLGRANEFGSSIQAGEGAPMSTSRPIAQPEVVNMRKARMQVFADYLKQQIERMPELKSVKNNIEIEMTDEGLRIQLLEDSVGVFFETGSPRPSEHGRELLALLGAELGKLQNAVRVEGYTDARPYAATGTYSNWELSTDRANTARRILTDHGLAAGQVAQIRGWADRALRVPSDPYAASNRRVAITLLFPESIAPAAARADSTLRNGRRS